MPSVADPAGVPAGAKISFRGAKVWFGPPFPNWTQYYREPIPWIKYQHSQLAPLWPSPWRFSGSASACHIWALKCRRLSKPLTVRVGALKRGYQIWSQNADRCETNPLLDSWRLKKRLVLSYKLLIFETYYSSVIFETWFWCHSKTIFKLSSICFLSVCI